MEGHRVIEYDKSYPPFNLVFGHEKLNVIPNILVTKGRKRKSFLQVSMIICYVPSFCRIVRAGRLNELLILYIIYFLFFA